MEERWRPYARFGIRVLVLLAALCAIAICISLPLGLGFDGTPEILVYLGAGLGTAAALLILARGGIPVTPWGPAGTGLKEGRVVDEMAVHYSTSPDTLAAIRRQAADRQGHRNTPSLPSSRGRWPPPLA